MKPRRPCSQPPETDDVATSAGASGASVWSPPACEPLAQAVRAVAPRHTVLLVDDDPGVRDMTALLLGNLGFHVLEAGGARDALRMLDSDSAIALLLTDYTMPGMNGVELVYAARRRRPSLPVVFVTGHERFSCTGMRNVQVLQKPFLERDLSERIARALSLPTQANNTSKNTPNTMR